jgi:hypothetical protein
MVLTAASMLLNLGNRTLEGRRFLKRKKTSRKGKIQAKNYFENFFLIVNDLAR